MKLTIPNSGNWLGAAANWRRGGGDRLELWLPRDWPRGNAELRWRRVASGGAARQGSQVGLEGLAPAEEIVVWTPAAETLLLHAQLPTRSAAKIAQALPYALEEQLIEPPERLHFAYAHEAGLVVDAPADFDSAAWREALGLPLEATQRRDGAAPAEPLNLLQQRYAPRGRFSAVWRAYVPAAALLAAWLAAALVFDAIEWTRLSWAARAADDENRALPLKSFPETPRNPRPAAPKGRGPGDLSPSR